MTAVAISLEKRRGEFLLDIDVRADSGVTALFGRSGCGKSTAVDLIAGLLKGDRGRIQIGDDVLFDSAARVDVPAEHRRIGYVFQDARLFPHYTVRAVGATTGISRSASSFAKACSSAICAALQRPGR